MTERIRQLFEDIVYPSFASRYNLNRKSNGEYAADVLEDHWQTFQEGFESAIVECVDIISAYTIRMENFDGGHPIDEIRKMFPKC